MKHIRIILLLAIVSFNCQKELSPENTSLLPTISTTTTTSITNTTALSGGNITDDGGATITARGVCWATTPNPDITGSHTTNGTGTGIFASPLTGLTANTTYHVRAYAVNIIGTAYGADSSFTTTSSTTALPTVTTASITAITLVTATAGGNVTADGGATVTARGVCWSTTSNPVATGNHTTDGTGTGIFTSAITGLSAGTLYHVRAYATNTVGTAYGGDSVFSTTITAVLPTVITSTISSITSTTASSGGNVTSNGGATVTARGVCWSTTANPVATGNHTTDGNGTGIFTSALTGLTAGTTYHVRAYATNSAGTAYGGDSSFTTTSSGSGTKIKRIIQSVTGTREAYITALTYDAGNRLLTFKEWSEDSSFTPIKITGENYSSFTYNGSNPYPVKNTITRETAGVDSTLYFYDASNRVIKEEYYYNGNISVRNTYNHLSANMVVLGKYVLSSPGPALHFMGNDSLIFDAQNRITGSRSGDASNVPKGSSTYTYDNKNNPFAVIDLFKYAFTLYCDDAKYFYRAPNNFTAYNEVNPPASTSILINYVTYNSGFYPLYATGSLTYTPGPIQNFTMTFEYY